VARVARAGLATAHNLEANQSVVKRRRPIASSTPDRIFETPAIPERILLTRIEVFALDSTFG
jgi:hypothetical protein